MIQEGCSQEDYIFFKREWLSYVRYYQKVDVKEIRDQLMNCLDTALQIVVYRALGSDVDITTQAELLWVIELLVATARMTPFTRPTRSARSRSRPWWWLTRT